MKKQISLKEAKRIVREYPNDEYYIQANYSMYFHPEIGMTDNSMQLYEKWHRCKEIVTESNKGKVKIHPYLFYREFDGKCMTKCYRKYAAKINKKKQLRKTK